MEVMPTQLPPGPKNRPLLGFIPEMRRDPLKFLTDLSLKYPKIAWFKLGSQPVYFVNEPEYVKRILLDNQKNYIKYWGYDKFYPVFGKGLLTSNGELWRKQRKLAQPAFHHQRLESFATAMVARTQRMLDDWRGIANAGTPFELGAQIRAVTMDIVTQTMFGAESSHETAAVGRALELILAETYDRVFALTGRLSEFLPTPKNLRFRRALATLNKLVYSIIAQRRKTNSDTGDLLSMYMLTQDEDTGEKMSDSQLRDEVMTIFLAGHETSAHTVAWTCYLLSKHPAIREKLNEELSSVLRGNPPAFRDLPKLQYLTQVIQEAMRLYPVSWIMSRNALSEDRLGGYTIPAKALLVISQYVIHRNPEHWSNPEQFDPSRFNSENSEKRSKFAYLPFGQGPRQCIGMGFAMMETQILMAMILQNYRLDLVPGHPVEPEPVMTLRPKHGAWFTLQARRA